MLPQEFGEGRCGRVIEKPPMTGVAPKRSTGYRITQAIVPLPGVNRIRFWTP